MNEISYLEGESKILLLIGHDGDKKLNIKERDMNKIM